jgi:hypothetical protein
MHLLEPIKDFKREINIIEFRGCASGGHDEKIQAN